VGCLSHEQDRLRRLVQQAFRGRPQQPLAHVSRAACADDEQVCAEPLGLRCDGVLHRSLYQRRVRLHTVAGFDVPGQLPQCLPRLRLDLGRQSGVLVAEQAPKFVQRAGLQYMQQDQGALRPGSQQRGPLGRVS